MSEAVFLPQDVIRKKRDREELSAADLKQFVDGTVSGAVSQGQIGAFTMAIYLNGMTRAERVAYTLAMRDTGRVIDWSEVGLAGPTIIDKHSSGGVGDEKVTLIVAPLVAACGIHIPNMSARGLGHTGGETDLLAAVPGYDFAPPSRTFMEAVRDIGCAVIGPTADLAPADNPIFANRDVCSTVESIDLITGSIMSKKLAAGSNGLVMTVPFGTGAFMKTTERAVELADSMIDVATGVGIPMVALISDLTQVLGDSVGNALQMHEVVRFLAGTYREPRLTETVLAIAEEIVLMGGLAPDRAEARRLAQARLDNGEAARRFARMIAAFGGPADFSERPEAHLPAAPVIAPVFPERDGVVQEMDCFAIGMAMVALGAGRTRPDDPVDDAVGISAVASVGARVGGADPLLTLHARSEESWRIAAQAIRAAITIGDAVPAPRPVIHARRSGGTSSG